MAAVSAPTPKLDRYVVIHVATTCDEHGVYVTKDSAEVIELGWILLDSKTCEEVHTFPEPAQHPPTVFFSCGWIVFTTAGYPDDPSRNPLIEHHG